MQPSNRRLAVRGLRWGLAPFAALSIGCANTVATSNASTDATTSTSASSSSSGAGGASVCSGNPLDLATITLHVNGMDEPTDTVVDTVTIEGTVVSADSGVIEIDPCLGDSGCVTPTATLTVGASMLPSVLAPVGALVRLSYEVTVGYDGGLGTGFGTSVLVENLASIGGATNPVTGAPRLWFAAFSTYDAAQPATFMPFVESKTRCDGTGFCAELWTFDSTIAFPQAAPFSIWEGEVKSVELGGSLAGAYTFAMLVNTSDCESHDRHSYWVVGL